MAFKRTLTVSFGATYAGLATVGYTILNKDDTTHQARTTTGVFEVGTNTGTYSVYASLPHKPCLILWDTGGASPVYAVEAINELAPPEGTVQASPTPTTSAFAGDSGLSATDDYYNNGYLLFKSGNLAGQPVRAVLDYVGATKLITVANALPAAPAAGDEFVVIGGRI